MCPKNFGVIEPESTYIEKPVNGDQPSYFKMCSTKHHITVLLWYLTVLWYISYHLIGTQLFYNTN